jgi:hypothetical protein
VVDIEDETGADVHSGAAKMEERDVGIGIVVASSW